MIRDITIGQYYPTDSIVHRLDPRTKLVGTMVFIITLFLSDSIWGYLLATAALAAVIRLTKVPFRFIVRGLKAIVVLLLISVSFNLFLTGGETDLAMAMEARCYRGGEGRTKMKPLKYASRDKIAYAVFAVYAALVFILRVAV